MDTSPRIALRTENPGWKTVKAIAEKAAQDADELIAILRDHNAEEPHPDLDDEWPVIHATRILGYQRDTRAIPELTRLMMAMYEDEDFFEDSILLNDAQVALERFNREEDFPLLWAEFLKYRASHGCDEILRAAAACGVATPELRREIEEYFEDEPVMAAWAMSESEDTYYLGILETRLHWLAPFVKYVPFERFEIPEHEEWIECGAAWYELKRIADNPWRSRDRLEPDLRSYYVKHVPPPDRDRRMTESLAEDAAEKKAVAEHFLSPLPLQRRKAGETLIERHRTVLDERDQMIDDYLAELLPPPRGKVGRNDPCPCGSSKKFKKCCGS